MNFYEDEKKLDMKMIIIQMKLKILIKMLIMKIMMTWMLESMFSWIDKIIDINNIYKEEDIFII